MHSHAATKPVGIKANNKELAAEAFAIWQRVREQRPLVQCITNTVSHDIMANVLLAAGCSPAMAQDPNEVEDFVSISSALLVNIGTMGVENLKSGKLAARKAVELGKPWVLDPVGCGATPFRTQQCLEHLSLRPTLVRGNGSEILALAGASSATRGVDSTAGSDQALEAAKQLARSQGCVVAISGATDLITDGSRVLAASNGVPSLQLITATGCSVTALAAAFLSAAPEQPLMATAAAMSIFGLAAEWAEREDQEARRTSGPGSLRVGLLDQLYCMDQDEVLKGARIAVLAD